MSVEVDYTVYLKGRTYTEEKEDLERKGYTVIPEPYSKNGLNLKKKDSGTMIYPNLGSFISSFEEDMRFNYKTAYFLNEMDVYINKIRMSVNLND